MAAAADAPTPLGKLPTVGYLWVQGSPVGYSLKYAQSTPLPEGGERVTLCYRQAARKLRLQRAGPYRPRSRSPICRIPSLSYM